MSAHDDHDVKILLYLDEKLTGQDLENFLAHLKGCVDCRERLAEEQALSNLLRNSRPLYRAPANLRARVTATIAQSTEPDKIPQLKNKGILRFAFSPFRNAHLSGHRWMTVAAMIVVVLLGFLSVPSVMRHANAATFIDAAVMNHQGYQDNSLPLEIRSSSSEAVTAWFAGKVPFQFRLPSPRSPLEGHPAYALTGGRVVHYKNANAALVTYRMDTETITLLVASDRSAVAAGGDEIRSGDLTFHYNKKAGLNVITWSTHGITYALVSSLHGSAQHSCLVCHQNMSDKNEFR